MQRNKSTKTEKIILVVLLFVLVAVIVWAYCVFTDTQLIKEKHNESYEKTYTAQYSIDIDEVSKYNPIYKDNINKQSSSYTISIEETDNYIKKYSESIRLYYDNLNNEETTKVSEYCHSLDTIELNYQITCYDATSYIEINSSFNLENLDGETRIQTDKLDFTIPVTYDQNYNDYANTLNTDIELNEPTK